MTYKTRTYIVGYMFLVPALFLLSMFFIYPLIDVFWISFHKWPIFGDPTWVGLKNFEIVLSNPDFWQAIKFTLIYTLTVTPMLFILAMVSALICNAKLPGVLFFRVVYFLPVVMSFATASFIWLWMYSEVYGIILFALRWIGGDAAKDLNVFLTGNGAMWAINFMVTWKYAGFSMIILLAGLQSIYSDYYEVAKLMGASRLTMIKDITLPMLKSSIALVLIMSIAGSIQAYEQFAIMTLGGPANETRTVMMLIVSTGFEYFKLGPASAMSLLVTVLLIALTAIQLRAFKKDY